MTRPTEASLARLVPHYDAARRSIDLRLVPGDAGLPCGFRLAFTSLVQITPTRRDVELVERLATYHVLAPSPAIALDPGHEWTIGSTTISHRPRHVGDGPVSAYAIHPDGSTEPVAVEPMSATGVAPPARHAGDALPGDLAPPALRPRTLTVDDARIDARPLALAGGATTAATGAWAAVAALARRQLGASPLDGHTAASRVVVLDVDPTLGAHASSIELTPRTITVRAAGPAGWRHALVTLTRWATMGLPTRATATDEPHYRWRGLHIDLARQWFEPDVVGWLIDQCAWRKLSHLHLHLTDDEAWRLPVAGFPALADAGARRGHQLPLVPMLGDSASPSGRAYTPDEIATWVARADALGVVLVPEVDLPAHAHALLTALPHLRDPDDTSGAVSVQFFTDNVVVPGHPALEEFLTAVVDAVADLFPSSPWIHIGGDEVPEGAWSGSPIVRRTHGAAGLSTRDVEAQFHRDLVRLIAERTGRAVGAWQEAAESGGVASSDGYVVGWRTIEASRELAAAGYDVVVSPGQAYYLDMAEDDDWWSPGASWAGETTLGDVRAFDPEAGWTDSERAHLLGIQACLWTEHVRDRAAIERMLFPRLDAIAARAWSGPDAARP